MDQSLTPKNVAIIMDGNGRWAVKRGYPRSFGHIKGTRNAKKIIQACSDLNLKTLTLYAFSSENWLRPKDEVDLLMKILQRYLKRETNNLIKLNIRFSCIGDLSQLPKDVLKAIDQSSQKTQHCTGMHLIFALSYGSQNEITQACRQIAEQVAERQLLPHQITPQLFESYLMTPAGCAPDLVIRTSGEKRLSNFLLWQCAYSEFYFTDTLWPDFKETDLKFAFADYSLRQRRYGKLSSGNSMPSKDIAAPSKPISVTSMTSLTNTYSLVSPQGPVT